MIYSPITAEQKASILKFLGKSDISELFSDIPDSNTPKNFGNQEALSEINMIKTAKRLANKNNPVSQYNSFLGGGVGEHFIPSIIKHITGRSEFYSSYTPYQPEISQGNLRVIFEFQSMISALTGLDIANASLYDGASALAEACVVAINAKKRFNILVPKTLSPAYIEVLKTYLEPKHVTLTYYTPSDGINLNKNDLKQIMIDAGEKSFAAVILPYPDYFGNAINVKDITETAKSLDMLSIFQFNPISLALLTPPGELGADIAVAEGINLGIPTCLGGPGLGLIAAKKEFLRLFPGRIVGETTDADGKTGYVLTFQTREQHIRREKSLSNICTNQGLMALAATVYLSTLGPKGLRQIAEHCYKKTEQLKKQIQQIEGFKILNAYPTFNECVIELPIPAKDALNQLKQSGVLGGLDLGGNRLLITVTELKTEQDIQAYVKALENIQETVLCHQT